AAGTGPAIRIASPATLRDTPARSSPAPTDMPIAIARCGIRKSDPVIAPIGRPREDAAPHARATQTSSVFVAIYAAFVLPVRFGAGTWTGNGDPYHCLIEPRLRFRCNRHMNGQSTGC